VSDQSRYFLTTTIPYVNARPHLGHALEFAQTDAFGRYHRLRGDDTYVLTGSDENALTNVRAAEREGISPRELVDRNSALFLDLVQQLEFSVDQFIRTSADPRHAAGAQKIWRAVAAAGDIYQKLYLGLYCVSCELFYQESELVNGLCPEHGTPPEPVEEENYFFRLSRYGEKLHALISTDRLQVVPDTRKNEVLSFIERGLQDFSISRSVERAHNWGIRVPDDPTQTMYVWFDALTNYITALDYATDGPLFQRYWLNNPNRVQALGKGVIRFHAVYWPAMLLSAGLPLPKTLFVHGYVNVAGTKMSKSLGNVVDPVELVQTYGSEAVRYYLLRAIPATGDANFTMEAFEARYTADLANDLGNLINRTISMIGRYSEGEIPRSGEPTDLERRLQLLGERVPATVFTAMDRYDPPAALDAVWELVTAANKYVEESAPWTLAREVRTGAQVAEDRLHTALYTLAESVRLLSALLEPFLPSTSKRIRSQLGLPEVAEHDWKTRLRWGGTQAGIRVGKAEPLFPRLEQAVTSER
jgi:methionyl-tRNA synthetase